MTTPRVLLFVLAFSELSPWQAGHLGWKTPAGPHGSRPPSASSAPWSPAPCGVRVGSGLVRPTPRGCLPPSPRSPAQARGPLRRPLPGALRLALPGAPPDAAAGPATRHWIKNSSVPPSPGPGGPLPPRGPLPPPARSPRLLSPAQPARPLAARLAARSLAPPPRSGSDSGSDSDSGSVRCAPRPCSAGAPCSACRAVAVAGRWLQETSASCSCRSCPRFEYPAPGTGFTRTSAPSPTTPL